MTPEEAKPHGLMFVTEMQMVDGKLCGPVHTGFTAKETAEIAKAYGMACLHSYMKDEANKMQRFENIFEGWSK